MSNIALQPVAGKQKADLAADSIRDYAFAKGPGWKLPTVVEMCDSLEVAFGTLDFALRRLEREGIIARKRGSGIYVTDRVHQKTIGVVFGGDILSPGFSPFWSLLLQAVREQAGERRFRVRTYLDIAESTGHRDDHEQLIEDLNARRLDGLLLLAPDCTRDHVDQLRHYGIPVASTDDPAPRSGPGMEWPEAFLRLATVELAATRCTRIGLLGRPDYRATIEKEMHRAGIPYVHVADWSYETWAWMIPGAHTREICAHALTTGMIAARPTIPLPGALVSFDDTMTRGAITALHQAGLQPGRDIRIVSLGNTGSPVLDPYTGDITIIEIDPADFVAAMLERLDSLVNGGPPPEHPAAVVPRLRKPGSGQSAGLPAAVILEQIEQARTGAQR